MVKIVGEQKKILNYKFCTGNGEIECPVLCWYDGFLWAYALFAVYIWHLPPIQKLSCMVFLGLVTANWKASANFQQVFLHLREHSLLRGKGNIWTDLCWLQCQSQLQGLYAEGIKGCCSEFASYGLLYIVFQHGNSRDLLSAMARYGELLSYYKVYCSVFMWMCMDTHEMVRCLWP